ncbi:C45 family peptidase [Thalassospiraceae bacterium LMO-JJ14]|nr:C45 family peptidase [Thalassospiraceae bacterium LMO-JJ14]
MTSTTNNNLKIIDAAGSPAELGHAIGSAVAASFNEAVMRNIEFRETQKHFAGSDYLKALRDAAAGAYPRHMRELDAMAAAIGTDTETLFLWNCRGDLRFPPESAQARLDAMADACTTVISAGDFANGIPAVIAHNEDGSGDFMAHRYWLRARPDDAPAFESYLYPGMLAGHSVAVTDAGLVQTINNVRADDLKPGIPRHFICRAVLEAENIADVIAHLRRPDRASGFHHAIAMRGIETPMSIEAPASASVIHTVDGAVGHANHLLDAHFAKLGQTVTASSDYRQTAVDAYLAEGGDPKQAENVLFKRGADGEESVLRRPGDGGDDYGCTLVTAVFRAHADKVEWAVHADPENLNAITGTFS